MPFKIESLFIIILTFIKGLEKGHKNSLLYPDTGAYLSEKNS
jgi:hypothetical protein